MMFSMKSLTITAKQKDVDFSLIPGFECSHRGLEQQQGLVQREDSWNQEIAVLHRKIA